MDIFFTRPRSNYQPRLAALMLALTLFAAPASLPARAAETPPAETADDLYLEKKYGAALPCYQCELDKLKAELVKSEKNGKLSSEDSALLDKAENNLADCLCQTGNFAKARAIYEAKLKQQGIIVLKTVKQLKKTSRAGVEIIDTEPPEGDQPPPPGADLSKSIFYCTEIGGTYFRQDQYGDAERYLKTAFNLLQKSSLSETEKISRKTQLAVYLGETLYRQNRFEEAAKIFRSALDGVAKIQNVSYETSKLLLGSLAGCYVQLKDSPRAVPLYRAMAVLDRSYFGDTDLNYGWSLLQLSDALKDCGKEKESRPLYDKAVWIFRQANFDRLAEQNGLSDQQLKEQLDNQTLTADQLATKKQIQTNLRHSVFGLGDTEERKNGDKDLTPPGSELTTLFDHCQAPRRAKLGAWNIKVKRSTESPGWVWTDPNLQQKAWMLCVPGLGLHHRAFQSFAERLIREGFTVVSFDVRGFGAYTQSKGHDKLDMDACLQDLISIITLMRHDYPDKPMFLLGESMGGALALRVVAEQPELVDGLVCSVPAAERHQETKTKLKIGLKIITSGNKAVDLTPTVLDKSVPQGDTKEKEEWKSDPLTRLKITPLELMNFDRFMKQNKIYAARVCHTPVLLFQGMNDRLVKEQGTQSLFRLLPTKDKALVLLGNQEHLIFEANPYKDDLTLGIIGWLNAHATLENACPPKVGEK